MGIEGPNTNNENLETREEGSQEEDRSFISREAISKAKAWNDAIVDSITETVTHPIEATKEAIRRLKGNNREREN